ncbi:MAG: twin-arginine translocase TatA/TatE family subunit [Bacteroidia bacterium]|nr:twin-arginine translocase TatA/TatE family subunit [Bacteroidia bacterium]
MVLHSTFLLLNMGGGEIFLIVIVMLMLFGSDKLPGIAKGLGKGLRELNDAKEQIQNEIQKNTGGLTDEIKKHASEIQSEITKANNSIQQQSKKITSTIEDEGKKITDTLS